MIDLKKLAAFLRRKPTIHINLFGPVWVLLGIILCFAGEISWWVFVLIVLSHLKILIQIGERKGFLEPQDLRKDE